MWQLLVCLKIGKRGDRGVGAALEKDNPQLLNIFKLFQFVHILIYDNFTLR